MKNYLLSLIAALFILPHIHASDHSDTITRALTLDVDATLFFRNNEFATPLCTGYTLPGFRLRPSVSYAPSRNVRIEGGLYALRFWGTDEYPNLAYRDIAYWDGTGHSTRGFHLVPFLRGVMETNFGMKIVLGSIYGAAFHRLPEPLYSNELSLTADPEAGLQVVWENPRARIDAWVNWESFIYRGDTHQEAFIAGVSGSFNYTRKRAPIRIYSPAAILIQHRGGEIDTLYHNSMQTLMNAAVGLGASRDFGYPHKLKRISLEAWFMAYRQVAGAIWPYENGTAWWIDTRVALGPMVFNAGWFSSHRFMPLLGYPFFGSVATRDGWETFGNTSTFTLGARFRQEFYPGYDLEAYADFYHQPSMTGHTPGSGNIYTYSATNSYILGVTMRLHPSFLLKKWK